VYTEWKDIPKDQDELQRMIKWMEDEIMKAFFIEEDKLYGISPIQHCRELIQMANLITSCICCRHWKIDEKRTYLLGTCELSSKDISYDRVCEFWSSI
jgi:hypothetical protein